MASVPQEERLVFCRVSQLAVLRLLTTREVMGEDVMTQREALRAYDDLLIDPRIDFIGEPEGVSTILSRISSRDEVSPKRWADDYLVAFAEAGNLTIATFDRAIAGRVSSSILLTP